MIERFKNRFVRTPEEIRKRFENRNGNEITPEQYFATLSENDKKNVEEVIDFFKNLQNVISDVKIAVLAVGSTVLPEKERSHPPEDIDLRVLNSSPSESEERENTINLIRDAIKAYMKVNRFDFMEENSTAIRHMVPERHLNLKTGKWEKDLIPYYDWYNNDPAFIIFYDDEENLPLHISISGVDNHDLDTYLRLERKAKNHFAVLLLPPQ